MALGDKLLKKSIVPTLFLLVMFYGGCAPVIQVDNAGGKLSDYQRAESWRESMGGHTYRDNIEYRWAPLKSKLFYKVKVADNSFKHYEVDCKTGIKIEVAEELVTLNKTNKFQKFPQKRSRWQWPLKGHRQKANAKSPDGRWRLSKITMCSLNLKVGSGLP